MAPKGATFFSGEVQRTSIIFITCLLEAPDTPVAFILQKYVPLAAPAPEAFFPSQMTKYGVPPEAGTAPSTSVFTFHPSTSYTVRFTCDTSGTWNSILVEGLNGLG